jgi:release factor glutamine methyltransferase
VTEEAWTIRKVLGWTTGRFEKEDIDAPRLTAEILLAFTLGVDRVKLYVELDRPLQKDELTAFRALIQRRLQHEPTQYLTGFKDFYNRRFLVDPRVLIPRSETELLVEAVLQLLPKHASRVLDLCTGSGCIAVTIAAERPLASVWATELSTDAAAVARANAEAHQVASRVSILEGDLFAPVPADARFDVVVSNPPYVKRSELSGLQKEVTREPRLALDGGEDGLDFVRRIAEGAHGALKRGGWLALEIGDEQGAVVKDVLTRAGYLAVRVDKDLARLDRLAFGQEPGPSGAEGPA